MTYSIEIRPKAEKFLKKLGSAETYLRIRSAIERLANEPRHEGSLRLSGNSGFYRVRVGDYRILYQIQDDRLVVLVVEIGHRKEIYR